MAADIRRIPALSAAGIELTLGTVRRIEAVMWDNDGVLVDTETLFFETTRTAFARMGLHLTREIWGNQYLGHGRSSHEIAESMGAEPEQVGPILEARNREYREVLRRPPVVRPGVRETLETLAGSVRLAIVTGSPRDQLELIHRSTGLLPFFEVIVTCDDGSLCKPHPEPYLRALAALNLRPAQCIAIEDSPRGLGAARAAGIACVVVPTELTAPLDFPGALGVEQNIASVPNYLDGRCVQGQDPSR